MLQKAMFCLTSDIDWASDYCIDDLVQLTGEYGVVPTLFATHESPAIRRFQGAHPDDLGIHPNFLPGSTHGEDHHAVIDHLLRLFPGVKSFRSHGFVDNTHILLELRERGICYDSNLCLHLQPELAPFRMGVPGITRFPVFWEDDTHMLHHGNDWDFRQYQEAFASPGLKIINVHPFLLAANIPSQEYYAGIKDHMPTLGLDDIATVRYHGVGVRTFLLDLLRFVQQRGDRFYTLRELHALFAAEATGANGTGAQGRNTAHTDVEHQRYWQISEEERQAFLRDSYNQRAAEDKYATSRDYHARELEIQAITQGITEPGTIVDLGCGNGYTLLSLARRFPGWEMIGVDFAESLIDGARVLAAEEQPHLHRVPEFHCADAIRYLRELADNSVRYVITERFILNLPSVAWQQDVTRDIFRVLQPGGRFLMCEGSRAGFLALNALREQMGLETIRETSADNISSLRIDDATFEQYLTDEVGFSLVDKLGFTEYFVISRVLHPLLVAPCKPTFDAKINTLARDIQEHLPFHPGVGSNVLWIYEKRPQSSR